MHSNLLIGLSNMFETSFFISLIGFLIVLTPLIFIHELGHYFAAIKAGVKVESFSIGFGPELFGFKDKRNTRWKFSLFPLGGYVKMKGDLVSSEKIDNKTSLNKDTFLGASLFYRFIIVLSGPLANLFLGISLISSIYVFNGRYVSPPILDKVLDSQPAQLAGLNSGDKILSINNNEISEFKDIKEIVEANPEAFLDFKVLRNNTILNLSVIPNNFYDKRSKKNLGRIGVTAKPFELKKLSFLDACLFGLYDSIKMTIDWINGFKSLLLLDVNKKDIIGPIGIAKISGSSLDKGFISVVFLMAVLSINLGLINLLPIPALDGGYILLFTYELIFRKPLPGIVQMNLLKFGFTFLIGLMILVTAFDLGY